MAQFIDAAKPGADGIKEAFTMLMLGHDNSRGGVHKFARSPVDKIYTKYFGGEFKDQFKGLLGDENVVKYIAAARARGVDGKENVKRSIFEEVVPALKKALR